MKGTRYGGVSDIKYNSTAIRKQLIDFDGIKPKK